MEKYDIKHYQTKKGMKIVNLFKKLITKKISFPKILLLLLALITTRYLIEVSLLKYVYLIKEDIFEDEIRFYLENLYYFIILFLILVFFGAKILKKKLIEVANFGIKIYPIIIIPPLIDYFILGRTLGYKYGEASNFLKNFISAGLLTGDAGIGISIEILLALLMIGLYIFYHTKSFLMFFLSIVFSEFFIILLSTPDLFFGQGRGSIVYDYFLPTYYFLPLIILSGLVYYSHNREKFKAIISNLRPLRSIIFISAIVLGFLVLAVRHLGLLMAAVFAVFFSWQFAVVINDIFDYKIDKLSPANKSRPLPRDLLSKYEYGIIALIFAFFSLSFGAVINFRVFLVVIFSLILGFVYSVPPFRLRKHILGNFIIGLFLSFCFIIGILTANTYHQLIFDTNIKIFILLLFLFGTVITLIKDIKDVEADSHWGIKNFYTIFGRTRGKFIVTLLLFGILNSPGLIMTKLSLLPITLIVSLWACYIYYKKENIKMVYTISSLLMVYIFIRLFGGI